MKRRLENVITKIAQKLPLIFRKKPIAVITCLAVFLVSIASVFWISPSSLAVNSVIDDMANTGKGYFKHKSYIPGNGHHIIDPGDSKDYFVGVNSASAFISKMEALRDASGTGYDASRHQAFRFITCSMYNLRGTTDSNGNSRCVDESGKKRSANYIWNRLKKLLTDDGDAVGQIRITTGSEKIDVNTLYSTQPGDGNNDIYAYRLASEETHPVVRLKQKQADGSWQDAFWIKADCSNPVTYKGLPSGFEEPIFYPRAISQSDPQLITPGVDAKDIITSSAYDGTGDDAKSNPELWEAGDNITVYFRVDMYKAAGQYTSETSSRPPSDVLVGTQYVSMTHAGEQKTTPSFGFHFEPGYYYYVVSVDSGYSQNSDLAEVIGDDYKWTSKYRMADESAKVPTSLKSTSKALKIEGVDYGGKNPAKDQVARPSGTLISDTVNIFAVLGSKSDVPDDKQWPKDIDGHYLPVTFCVDIYGPYANLQPDTQYDVPVDAKRPIGKSSNGKPAYGNAINDHNHQCLTANNGPGDYTVFFKDSGDYQAGFYHTVVTIKKSDQSNAIVKDLLLDGPPSTPDIHFVAKFWDRDEAFSKQWEATIGTDAGFVSNDFKSATDIVWIADLPNWDVMGNVLTDSTGTDHINNGDFAGGGNFGDDIKEAEVTLYGPYGDKPKASDCQADKAITTKTVNFQNSYKNKKDLNGNIIHEYTPVPVVFTRPDGKAFSDGHYAFVINYLGSDRIAPYTSSCDDERERFEVPPSPSFGIELATQIRPDGEKFTVPTIIHDTVRVSGDKNVVAGGEYYVGLELYKAKNPKKDSKTGKTTVDGPGDGKDGKFICQVKIPINDLGSYKTEPNDTDCKADEPGYYYWKEGLYRKDNDQPYGKSEAYNRENEGAWFEWPEGKITTAAPPVATVGDKISDTAIVSGISPNDPRRYKITIKAYGPQAADGSAPVCTTPFYNWSRTFEGKTIMIGAKNGSVEYQSAATTVNTAGRVFWIETLEVEEGGNWKKISEGRCGNSNETTTVTLPPSPPSTSSAPPILSIFPPESGMIVRSVASLVGLIAGTLVIWRLLTHKPILFWRK